MTKLNVYKIKFEGKEKPDYLEKYQIESPEAILPLDENIGGFGTIKELVNFLEKYQDYKYLENFNISFQKPFDIHRDGNEVITAKNLNLLEKLSLKRGIAKKFMK